jgi:hypothetical protein
MKFSNFSRLFTAGIFVWLFTISAAAQDTGGEFGSYTFIDYDEDTNIVRAYSQTDSDYNLMGDYEARVSLTVTNDYGVIVASGSGYDDGYGYATVELSFAGEPDRTYTAVGTHRAFAYLWDYDYDYDYYYRYRPVYYYYDNWYFTGFEGGGIYQPWYYSFYRPSYSYFRRRTQNINLGKTYDSASTIPVPNRGQIQAQGSNPPVEKSRSWAQTSVPTKSKGLEMINAVWDSLTRSERRERGQAYTDAYRYIENSPREGRPFNGTGGKNFYDPQRSDPTARIDVVVIRGLAFKDDDFWTITGE